MVKPLCVHVNCGRQRYIGQLCTRHHRELDEWTPPTPVDLARLGRNESCVQCGSPPLFGGLRCHDCFLSRVEAKRGSSDHAFPDKPATVGTYIAGCRCWECRKASAESRKRQRREAAR